MWSEPNINIKIKELKVQKLISQFLMFFLIYLHKSSWFILIWQRLKEQNLIFSDDVQMVWLINTDF